MSDDPKRLLDDDVSDDERRALMAGQSLEPPSDAHQVVLAGVLAELGRGVASGGAGTSGVTSGGASAAGVGSAAGASTAVKSGLAVGAWIKAFAVGGGVTAAALVGHEMTSEPIPNPVVTPSAVSVTAPPAPPPPPLASVPSNKEHDSIEHKTEPEPKPNAAVVTAQQHDPSIVDEPDAATTARWESAMVGRARNQLRSGQAGKALQTLEAIRKRAPGGVLVQEREALTIEALAASGQSATASARAEAFLSRFPASPHASRVRTFVK